MAMMDRLERLFGDRDFGTATIAAKFEIEAQVAAQVWARSFACADIEDWMGASDPVQELCADVVEEVLAEQREAARREDEYQQARARAEIFQRALEIIERTGLPVSVSDPTWCGSGSTYVRIEHEEDVLEIRFSDRAQRRGGGLRWVEWLGDYDRAGDSDISFDPASGFDLARLQAAVDKFVTH